LETLSVNDMEPGLESARAAALYQEAENTVHQRTDRLFAKLMVLQWLAGIGAALWISPKTWIGATSEIHWHIWAAIFLGGMIAGFPVYLAWKNPGKVLTRHVIAVAQIFFSALLIHLTGGRIETHFHIFGSLAFLAFYRDWKVLASATIVVALDHFLRGMYWPQSIFGVVTPSHWRWLEHAGWILFEDTFLVISIRQSLREMRGLAQRQASLETLNTNIELKVTERTKELTREVTERRKAEGALLESEALYHSLVEQMPGGIFRKDLAGRFVLVNLWFCHLRGATPEKFIGKMPQDLAAAENNTDILKTLHAGTNHHAEIIRTGRIFEVEEQYPGPDGSMRHFQVIKSPVFGADGKIAGSQGIVLDITERKKAEAELNHERNMLRTLINNSPDPIYIKDTAGCKIMANPAELKSMGCKTEAEALGKTDFDIYPQHLAAVYSADDQAVIQTGQPLINREEKIVSPSGETFWLLSSKIPLRDSDGKIVGLIGMGRNISVIKDAEARLNQVHKQLLETSRQAGMAEVATNVLHNVGNVLNSVNVSSSLISEKIKTSRVANLAKVVALLQANEKNIGSFLSADPKGKQLPGYLASLTSHLAQEQEEMLREASSLVNNVIHIKEIVAMQQDYAKSSGILESLQVTELVEDALRMNLGAMQRHNVKVVRDFADLPAILTEKHKVLQILVNLIRNAKYACDESGKDDKWINLRVRNGDDRIKISVIDNGIGIPPENLTRIFNHGFTTRKGGHGFGLHSGAIAAKELGGTLAVSSEGIGQGATFTLEIPAKPIKNKATP
jgi:PAS domain S-box-containing protein